MLQLVQSHTNFLASFKASSSDSAFEAALAAHAVRLRTALGNMPDPRLDDASAAMAILQHSCFTKHQKDELVATISAAVSCPSIAASKEGVSRLVPQEMLFFHRYLTKEDWDVLIQPSFDWGNKIQVMVDRASQIGLLSISEKSVQALVCVLIAANNSSTSSSSSSVTNAASDIEVGHQLLLMIKAAWRKLRLHKPADLMQSLAVFPADVAAFKAQCPHRCTFEPAPCPIDDRLIDRLRDKIGCRKTHASMRQAEAASASSGGGHQLSSVSQCKDWSGIMPMVQAMLAMSQSNHQKHTGIEWNHTPPRREPLPARLAIGDISRPSADESQGSSAKPSLDTPPDGGQLEVKPPVGVTAAADMVRDALQAKSAKVKDAAKAKAKAKASAKASAKAGAKAKPTKPSAKGATSEGLNVHKRSASIMLGCGKCRGARKGCSQCKNPKFNGRRYQRA